MADSSRLFRGGGRETREQEGQSLVKRPYYRHSRRRNDDDYGDYDEYSRYDDYNGEGAARVGANGGLVSGLSYSAWGAITLVAVVTVAMTGIAIWGTVLANQNASRISGTMDDLEAVNTSLCDKVVTLEQEVALETDLLATMLNMTKDQALELLSNVTNLDGRVDTLEEDSVMGPASGTATDEALVRWDTTEGRLVQDSSVLLTDAGALSGITDITLSGTVDGVDVSAHAGDATIHFTEGSIDHTAITNIGTNSHAAIDTHIADATLHFTEASIDHTAITNIGTNSHAAIDTHIADATLHFTEGSIDHTAITNIGTNSHAAIDTHIADGTIHFTEGSIDHTAITNIGTNSHAAIDTHIADATLHFTEGSIDHTNIVAGDGSDHTFIDQSVTTTASPSFAGLTSSAINGGTVEAVSGPGAISPLTLVTTVTTTGADALTLADGTDSQLKIITMIADGGDGTLTPTTLNGGTTLTFNDVGDTVMLLFVNTLGWTILSNNGAVLA